jgi:hypothetical protein
MKTFLLVCDGTPKCALARQRLQHDSWLQHDAYGLSGPANTVQHSWLWLTTCALGLCRLLTRPRQRCWRFGASLSSFVRQPSCPMCPVSVVVGVTLEEVCNRRLWARYISALLLCMCGMTCLRRPVCADAFVPVDHVHLLYCCSVPHCPHWDALAKGKPCKEGRGVAPTCAHLNCCSARAGPGQEARPYIDVCLPPASSLLTNSQAHHQQPVCVRLSPSTSARPVSR